MRIAASWSATFEMTRTPGGFPVRRPQRSSCSLRGPFDGALESAAQRHPQFFAIVPVLGDDAFRLAAQELDVLIGQLLRRHHDDWQIDQPRPLAQLAQKLEA